ncbi:hypothetical protein AA0472_3119 [Acetobacter estunensis NRIC 0472]|uniref:Mannosyltransferase n=1 Tax=Acetobacter estunensis TaxID=104097 RepID=A0A967B5A3_9PROT|nr:capsular polysaccharide synthesis protein [Acetobacter estunensis]NHO53070.1 hypothetical protein [Acetobacter estunensis]GBQ29842.1 hypothetical protein AA0472_3119 [Acetobacter estunensis NRIC 0472]
MLSKSDLRLWKDAAKSLFYGIASKERTAPSFMGWTDTLATGTQTRSESAIPRIVWMYWDGDTKPPLVEATIARVRALNPDHDVRLLDNRSVREHIEAPFLERSDLAAALKSDLIRLELLAQYGGIWVDATCIFHESLQWVHDASCSDSADLVAYYRAQDTQDRRFPIIESWFLACPPQTTLVQVWRDELRKVLTLGRDAYFRSLVARPDYDTIRQGIERPEYLLVYLAEQIALREAEASALFLRKAEDGPFLYQMAVRWDRERIATLLCRLDAPVTPPPVIKLTHSNRYLLPLLIRLRLVRGSSVLGRFLESLAR